MEIVAVNTKRN